MRKITGIEMPRIVAAAKYIMGNPTASATTPSPVAPNAIPALKEALLSPMANPRILSGARSAIRAEQAGSAKPSPTPKIKADRCRGIGLVRKKKGKAPIVHNDMPARITGILPSLSDNLPAWKRVNTDPM
jgi:hypothetical protein